MSEQQFSVVTIWCVVSDQQGRVLLVNNKEEKIQPWHLPSGVVLPKSDDSINSAVRRIMRDSIGTTNILFRQLETRIVKKQDGKFELQVWYLCIPVESLTSKIISWETVEKFISFSFLPHTVAKTLAKVG